MHDTAKIMLNTHLCLRLLVLVQALAAERCECGYMSLEKGQITITIGFITAGGSKSLWLKFETIPLPLRENCVIEVR